MPVVGIPGEVKASATTVVRFLCDFVGLKPQGCASRGQRECIVALVAFCSRRQAAAVPMIEISVEKSKRTHPQAVKQASDRRALYVVFYSVPP